MINSLKKEIASRGDRAVVFPIRRLKDIQHDFEELQANTNLNNFQRYLVNKRPRFDPPDTGFEARSIVLVATPVSSLVKLMFTWRDRKIMALLPVSYVEKNTAPTRIEGQLNAFLDPHGYHVSFANSLPRKIMAVRSGLGKYGKNNLCFVEGMGSFLNLASFYSDIPCTQDSWQEIQSMEICHSCQACQQSCPTGAISPTRFLIDNERCLTYFNEAGREWNFPEWIDPLAHHTIYGCLRCQTICPVNKPYIQAPGETVDFNEEETFLLLEGKPVDLFPDELIQKINRFEMREYLGAIPRNLRALFNQPA